MITTMHSDQNGSPPRVEVITSVQRRRRWPTAEKIRLVEETMQPGMSVSYVARRTGVAPSLLFSWRRRMLEHVVGTSRVRELERRVREPRQTRDTPCWCASITPVLRADRDSRCRDDLVAVAMSEPARLGPLIGKTERMPPRPVQHKRSTMPVRSVCDLPRGPNA